MSNKNAKNNVVSEESWITAQGIEYTQFDCGIRIVLVKRVSGYAFKADFYERVQSKDSHSIVPMVNYKGAIYSNERDTIMDKARRWVQQ